MSSSFFPRFSERGESCRHKICVGFAGIKRQFYSRTGMRMFISLLFSCKVNAASRYTFYFALFRIHSVAHARSVSLINNIEKSFQQKKKKKNATRLIKKMAILFPTVLIKSIYTHVTCLFNRIFWCRCSHWSILIQTVRTHKGQRVRVLSWNGFTAIVQRYCE